MKSYLGQNQVKLPFGLKDGELVHISKVPSGLACECVCSVLISAQYFPVSALILPTTKSFRALKNTKIESYAGQSWRCFLKRAGKIWTLINTMSGIKQLDPNGQQLPPVRRVRL